MERAGASWSRTLAALAVVVVLLPAVARAAPGPFQWSEIRCPAAVLPLRMATFQARPGAAVDLDWSLTRSEFRESRPVLGDDAGFGDLVIVVLAYVGADATELLVEVHALSGAATWTERVAIPAPHEDPGRFALYPRYLVVELPREAWGEAFPVAGLYTIQARAADATLEPGCGSRTSTWIVVSR